MSELRKILHIINQFYTIFSTCRTSLTSLLTVVLVLFFVFSACDHTDLQGEITCAEPPYFIGDTIHLQLEIPQQLDGIYWVHWQVEPVDAGEIVFPEASVNPNETDVLKKYGKEDRAAVFIPAIADSITIAAYGYYKQTNPQPITRKKIYVGKLSDKKLQPF